jgi:putative spermidine/putrescine transport system substrate-binding protein
MGKYDLTRRRALGAFTAGLAGSGLAAPSFFIRRAVAADPKRLVIYNFDGVLGQFYDDYWIKPFAQANDIKIETITMVGSAPPLDKLAAQINAGRPEADMVPLQPPQLVFAERNNLLMTIPRGSLKEASNYYEEYITDYGPKLILWCYGLAYNKQKITTAPTRWRDMWDAKFKGQVGLNDALFEQALQMANLAFTGKPTPIDDETFKRLSMLKPNIVSLWTTGAQAEQLFRTGEIAISPLWNGRVFKLIDEGVPLDFVVPEEGFFTRWNAYTVPRNAQNPDLAIRFIDFIMAEKQQSVMAEKLSYGSPHKTLVYPTAEVARRVVVASKENMSKAVPEDFAAIADKMPEWTRRWNQWKAS